MTLCDCSFADIEDVINDDTDAVADSSSADNHQTSASTAWDLSRAALQVEQMIEPRFRTKPLGNCQLHTIL